MFYIRADANKNIGMGHIMRCLSIADAAKAVHQECAFIIADENVKKFIESKGYRTHVLGSDYHDMENELERWPKTVPDYIIVDSYFVTSRYLNVLKQKAKVIYIDDLYLFPYPVNVLINYNIFGPNLNYRALYGGNPPKLILGAYYAPLRSMFRGIRKKTQKREVTDILISTGGSDPLHLALSFVKANPGLFRYHILVGALNVDRKRILIQAQDKTNIVLHENVADMNNLISSCDIAVSAAGSTLYEICACGVPLITYSIADNQISGAESFSEHGFAMNLGDMRREHQPVEKILAAVKELSTDYKKRIDMGTKMQDMIDGFGADRLLQEVLAP